MVLLYIRFPLRLRNLEVLFFERGIDFCHETVRLWWNRFGPMFAADIHRQWVSRMKSQQEVVSIHAALHNHFKQEPQLLGRRTNKLRRPVARQLLEERTTPEACPVCQKVKIGRTSCIGRLECGLYPCCWR